MRILHPAVPLLVTFVLPSLTALAADDDRSPQRQNALTAMRQAAGYFREEVAVHGGYVYHYSEDLQKRWGEGPASPSQVWVQPPGTPTVGLAYLAAYRATQDEWYLAAARETAEALIYGQLASGGWTNSIDFDPQGQVALYRRGQGRGRNYSTLDDGITQNALRFLMQCDAANDFREAELHEAAQVGLTALLQAQFPNGGFPQVWSGPSQSQQVVPAAYPDYEWRTENRIKEYWDLYTLNDGLTGHVADTLIEAESIYQDELCTAALTKLGDFLLLAQMPDPQPGWAQQYDYAMRPVWARKFEPPAIAGRESEDAIATLMKVTQHTGDPKHLEPIPRALEYLKSSLLADGQLARYYELRTNRPLYMTEDYQLTYDDSDAPSHYGWKTGPRLDGLQREYQNLKSSPAAPVPTATRKKPPSDKQVQAIIDDLDDRGRWVSEYQGATLIGQAKFRPGDRYLSSEVFAHNLTLLSTYVAAQRP